jgi:hypothetical protein
MPYKPIHPEEAGQYGYVEKPASPSVPVMGNPQQTTGGFTPIQYSPVSVYQPGQNFDSFKTQATNQYTPAYNEKVAALKNALAQNLAALEGQKTGINQNYDTQVSSQNFANTRSKNNYSNSMLGRGLGRSSIATTGLSEQDMINNRAVNQINTYRTSALGNVDAQKVATETGTNNQIASMASDLQTQILALAQNLYDSYQNNLFKQESFNAGNKLDTDKYNTSTQLDYNKFDYGKTQDAFGNDLASKNYDLDKWYKEQMIDIQKQELAANAAKQSYKSPNGFGTDSTAKEYDQVLSTAKYIVGSNRPMANKLSDLESMITQAKAERNPSADALANQLQSMLNSLRMQASAQSRSLIEKNAQIAPSTYKAPQPDAISGAAPIKKPYWKK